jgi:hypothetical protein
METKCINYNNSEFCNIDINCGWCPDPYINNSICLKNYSCYPKIECANNQNELCSIVGLFHNLTIIVGFVTSGILINVGISKYLLNRGVNSETSFSIAGVSAITVLLPVIFSFFFYYHLFMFIFTGCLLFSLLLNVFLYR